MTNLPPLTRHRSSRHRVVAASTLLAAALPLLAACGGNGLDVEATGTPSPAATSSPSPSPSTATPSPAPAASAGSASPPASASPAPASTTSPAATPPTCRAGGLQVGERSPAGGGAAGSNYLLLAFRNTSSSTCVLDGHPGVSFVGGGDGSQVGAAADRTGGVQRVVLQPGATTSSLLRVVDPGVYDADTCAPTTADGFRVYPPDSRASVFVAFRTTACQGTDLPDGSQLTVSAVGDAGR